MAEKSTGVPTILFMSHSFFFSLFPLLSFSHPLRLPSFHSHPFPPTLSPTLFDALSYRVKPIVKPVRKMVPRFSSLASLRQLFLRTVFPLLARAYHSPGFFHRPQSFSATFRFASQMVLQQEKCNKWLLFVN